MWKIACFDNKLTQNPANGIFARSVDLGHMHSPNHKRKLQQERYKDFALFQTRASVTLFSS